MNKSDISALLTKHDAAIQSLEKSTGQMLMLWRIVGVIAGIVLTVWLSALVGDAA
jgi:hypothetical protein